MCLVVDLDLETVLGGVVSLSAKFAHEVDFLILLFKQYFLFDYKAILKILILLHNALLPRLMLYHVNVSIFDCCKRTCIIELCDKLLQTHDFIKIYFSNNNLIFSQLNVVLNLALLDVKELILSFLF